MNTQIQEALKMAISALEDSRHVIFKEWFERHDKAIQACKEALEQPAQEPVAYILRNEYNEYRLEPMDNLKITDFPVEVEVKLYTHPAPSWQGLSDDEIIDMYFQASISPQPHQSIINFIRAIEQALKEKNGH